MDKRDDKKIETVTADEVVSGPHLGRRTVLAVVAGSVAGAAALLVGSNALASKNPGVAPCTDSDSGPNADGPGRGRGNGRSDSDSGPNEDRPGCGRS